MLDLLPNEIWSDSSIKILDPACKSGVFLREAAKRFLVWLEEEIPNLQERINHIMTKQLFWIGITNLTSLLSRRSLYCSKNAKYDEDDDLWKYSICTEFKTSNGNIWFDRVEHEWKNWSCIHCGASQSEYEREEELESHAYKFIHSTPKEINDLFNLNSQDMFDVIIGNPPYQLSDWKWWWWASASPLYHLFVEQAKKLDPKYLIMIIPSRRFSWWKWLDTFRASMLDDNRISKIIDYPNASDCFPWVDVSWGVNYFLREKNHTWDCSITTIINGEKDSMVRPLNEYDVFVRRNKAIPIIKKVLADNEETLDNYVSPRRPFWIDSTFNDFNETPSTSKYKIYSSNNVWVRKIWYTDKKNVTKWEEYINHRKVLMPKAYRIWSKTDGWYIHPIIAEPWSVCTETFLVMKTFKNKEEAENFAAYIKTRFFRFLVYLRKITQNTTSKVYWFVPVLDFSKLRTDELLYGKYKLTKSEIDYIESLINPMD